MRERNIAVMHQQGIMRNINESIYDFMRIRGDSVFTSSYVPFLQRYVEHYDKQGLRVTIITASTGEVLFDSSFPTEFLQLTASAQL